MADKNHTRAEVIQIVADAARSYGIPKDDFLRASYIETGGQFDERAYNAGSRAAGLFQFLPSTAEAYGIRGREFDPTASAGAAARFYLDNQRSIVQGHSQTGRPYLSGGSAPTGLDMYIAHQQGAAGYRSIQAGLATGDFSRADTRINILSNISPKDVESITGRSMTDVRGMADGDLARHFVSYWDTKYNRIAIPEQQIAPRTGGVAPTAPGQAAADAIQPVLRLRDEGAAVARLQQQLSDRGITQANGQALDVDGRFGPKTEEAVKRFQARAGLETDGVVGQHTRGALNDPALADGMLRQGESGASVQRLQERLIEAGITGAQGRPLRADGQFGPQTQAAVLAYQRQQGLGADGIAGPKTMDALAGMASGQNRAAGRTQAPATIDGARWPAPGNHEINRADKSREGRGEFGTPRSNRSGIHAGLDIQGQVGDPIQTFQPGKVLFAGQQAGGKGFGNYIVIEHADRKQTVYAHLDSMSVRTGDSVVAGQTIGAMGRSGNTPAQGDTHLHFELRENATPGVKLSGTPVDPLPHLRTRDREPQRAVASSGSPSLAPLPTGLVSQQAQVNRALADRLGALGYGAAQIDSITGAMAVANARDGELLSPGTRFHVGRDGQRVAAQYTNGSMRELDIPSALEQTGSQHLHLLAQSMDASQSLTERNNSAMVMQTREQGRAFA